MIASSGADNTIRLFSVQEVDESAAIEGKLTPEQVKATNEPGVQLQAVKVTEVSSAHGTSDINSVAWYPNEDHADWLASGGDDGSVRIWRVVRD